MGLFRYCFHAVSLPFRYAERFTPRGTAAFAAIAFDAAAAAAMPLSC